VKISLRRASRLARACGREAQTIVTGFEKDAAINCSLHTMNSEDAISSRLDAASNEAMDGLADALNLFQAQWRIRALIGQANAERVTDLLTERAVYLAAAEKTLKSYLDHATRTDRFAETLDSPHDASEIAARLAGIRRRLEKVTTGNVQDYLRVSRLSEANLATIRQLLADMQRRYLDLDEERDRANDKMITLTDETVTTLRKHKIVT